MGEGRRALEGVGMITSIWQVCTDQRFYVIVQTIDASAYHRVSTSKPNTQFESILTVKPDQNVYNQ